MASVSLSPTVAPSHSSSSSAPSCSLTFLYSLPSRRRRIGTIRHVGSLKWNINTKSRVVPRFALDGVSVLDPPPPTDSPDSNTELINSLKLKLLSAVSGLNRGLAANEDDLRRADDAAKDLEAAGGPVDLSAGLDKLQGKWKLVYSSAFSSRTLGGSRPGPPTGRLLPITLGQVFQRIDVVSKDFDNIVELQLGVLWPFPPIEVTATLAHKFELIGSTNVKITFVKTTVKTTGNLSQLPLLEIPRIPDALRPPANRGSGEFEVTYVDSDTRITRGDKDSDLPSVGREQGNVSANAWVCLDLDVPQVDSPDEFFDLFLRELFGDLGGESWPGELRPRLEFESLSVPPVDLLGESTCEPVKSWRLFECVNFPDLRLGEDLTAVDSVPTEICLLQFFWVAAKRPTQLRLLSSFDEAES
ncbi:hypothetical protein Nepgr_030351 [Nepenthes gracilis]|uniref:Plastid lipid-associated protein/fibrillin conserved domain-containing protein n=1 Tax=Nepenthes gracilis TaxID=150966 RepID=A0AAD3TGB9_NEPGR|nr:hypothetical protein Nepgr_030351 [Nepenthes gracilis]